MTSNQKEVLSQLPAKRDLFETLNRTSIVESIIRDIKIPQPNQVFFERADTIQFANRMSVTNEKITEELVRQIMTLAMFLYQPHSEDSYNVGNISTIPIFLTNVKTEQIKPNVRKPCRSSMFITFKEKLPGTNKFGGITSINRYTIGEDTPEYYSKIKSSAIILTTCKSVLLKPLQDYIDQQNLSIVYVTDFTTYSVNNVVYDTNNFDLIWYTGSSIFIFQNMFYEVRTWPSQRFTTIMPIEFYMNIQKWIDGLNLKSPNGLSFEAFQTELDKNKTFKNRPLNIYDFTRDLPVQINNYNETVDDMLTRVGNVLDFFKSISNNEGVFKGGRITVQFNEVFRVVVSHPDSPVNLEINMTADKTGHCLIYTEVGGKSCTRQFATLVNNSCDKCIMNV